eukprot:tig00021179_g19226.t1
MEHAGGPVQAIENEHLAEVLRIFQRVARDFYGDAVQHAHHGSHVHRRHAAGTAADAALTESELEPLHSPPAALSLESVFRLPTQGRNDAVAVRERQALFRAFLSEIHAESFRWPSQELSAYLNLVYTHLHESEDHAHKYATVIPSRTERYLAEHPLLSPIKGPLAEPIVHVVDLESEGSQADEAPAKEGLLARARRRLLDRAAWRSRIRRRVPIVEWIREVTWRSALKDVIAGTTVACTLIPQAPLSLPLAVPPAPPFPPVRRCTPLQSMAYAQLANLPPVYGLYAALFPQLVYLVLGTSRQAALGPVAVVSLLTEDVGARVAAGISLAFFSGLINFAMGVVHLGWITEFLSHPGALARRPRAPARPSSACPAGPRLIRPSRRSVRELEPRTARRSPFGLPPSRSFPSRSLIGFMIGAAINIAASQTKDIFGISVPKDIAQGATYRNVGYQIGHLGETKWESFVFGVVALVVLVAVRFVNRRYKLLIPGPLIVVVAGTGAAYGLQLPTSRLSVVGDVPKAPPYPPAPPPAFPRTSVPLQGLPSFEVPPLGEANISGGTLIGSAISIALIGYMETIAIGRQFARRNGYKIDPDQELIALGASNVLGSFVQSYPICVSFSRTAINAAAGATSNITKAVSALWVALALLVLTPLVRWLPKPVLASIVLLAVIELLDFQAAAHIWRFRKWDFLCLLVCVLAVIFLGVEIGVGIGIGFSLLLVLARDGLAPTVARLGRVPGTEAYRDLRAAPWAVEQRGVAVVQPRAPLLFYSRRHLAAAVRRAERLVPGGLQAPTPPSLFHAKPCLERPFTVGGRRRRCWSSTSRRAMVRARARAPPAPRLDPIDGWADGRGADIDSDGVVCLREIIAAHKERDVPVLLCAPSDAVAQYLDRAELRALLGPQNVLPDVATAVQVGYAPRGALGSGYTISFAEDGPGARRRPPELFEAGAGV